MPERGATRLRFCLSAAALSCLLLAACANPVGLTSSTLTPEQSALAYYQWVRSASVEARQAELRNLRTQLQPQPQREVKMALVLSVPPTADADQVAEASRLLSDAAHVPGHGLPDDYRILASHWLEVLALRGELHHLQRQLQEGADTLARLQQEHAVLERGYAVQSETVNSLQAQKTLLEQQNRIMQKQIDALTAIEQQLVDQDPRGGNKQP